MTNQKPFITSVRVQASAGGHEYVSIWIRGANVGTLCVGKGEGEQLARLLQGCSCSAEFLDRHAVHMFGCRMVSLGDRVAFEGAPPNEPVDEGTSVQSHPRRPRLWPPLSRDEYLEKLREFERRPREWPLSGGLLGPLEPRQAQRRRVTLRGDGTHVEAPECTICGRPCCECTTPGTCGRCHGCTVFRADDPRVRAQRRIALGLDASLRADEQERRRTRVTDHAKAEEGPGAPAPPLEDAEPGAESRPSSEPPAAGAPELT